VSHNALIDLHDGDWRFATSLQHLNLAENHLTSISALRFEEMQNLTHLNVSLLVCVVVVVIVC
jgi:Leucine-rich repeat (LRR) protein